MRWWPCQIGPKCQWAHRFRLHRHAFDSGVCRAPVAFGKDARFGSEPRNEGFGPSATSGRRLNRFVEFLRWPGVHRTDYGLTTGINIHVLDCDLLLTLAAIALQCLNLRRKRPQ